MTIEELYQNLGESYESTLSRLISNALIAKLIKMFLEDKSFENIEIGIANKDAELAFRSAHTLKGIAFNLGFNKYGNLASEITELFRGRDLNVDYAKTLNLLKTEHEKIIGLIKETSL